jgi:hypothetical protein
MPDLEQYALVLGTGEAGKYMAWHLGGSGKRTAVIEPKYLGGACVPAEQERNPVSEGRLLECRLAAQSFSSL